MKRTIKVELAFKDGTKNKNVTISKNDCNDCDGWDSGMIYDLLAEKLEVENTSDWADSFDILNYSELTEFLDYWCAPDDES